MRYKRKQKKEQRRLECEERQEERNQRTTEEQLALIAGRPGGKPERSSEVNKMNTAQALLHILISALLTSAWWAVAVFAIPAGGAVLFAPLTAVTIALVVAFFMTHLP